MDGMQPRRSSSQEIDSPTSHEKISVEDSEFDQSCHETKDSSIKLKLDSKESHDSLLDFENWANFEDTYIVQDYQ